MIQTNNTYGTQLTKNNSWNVGDKVNVGFMKGLTVIEIKSNTYILEGKEGRLYEFIPHNGIVRIN